jgi:hypothetical protein
LPGVLFFSLRNDAQHQSSRAPRQRRMLEYKIASRFPRDPDAYYALMLDGAFQQDLHVRGLKMARTVPMFSG